MSNLVEVQFAGGTILVTPVTEQGAQAMSVKNGVIKAAEQSLECIMSTVKNMGQSMSESLSKLEFATAEATFGISFNGKGQFIVTTAPRKG